MEANDMLTLTFKRNEQDLDEAWKAWAIMKRYLNTTTWGRRVVVVPELQKRGAIHFHVAIHRPHPHYRIDYDRVRKEWSKATGEECRIQFSWEKWSQYRREGSDQAGYISRYLAKYLTKDLDWLPKYRKRYDKSRSIPPPEIQVLYIPYRIDWRECVDAIIFQITGEYPEGWVDWRAGVLWAKNY